MVRSCGVINTARKLEAILACVSDFYIQKHNLNMCYVYGEC